MCNCCCHAEAVENWKLDYTDAEPSDRQKLVAQLTDTPFQFADLMKLFEGRSFMEIGCA
jgi:hypothetical protein